MAASTGFLTAFSLILVIGAQNALVLRQGLLQVHVFWLCLFFAISDAVLIVAGVVGFGAMVTAYPVLPKIMTWGGVVFLVIYGLLRFKAAHKGDYKMELAGKSAGLWQTLAIGAGFTWLNPHVYLDTVGLIGAISTQFTLPGDKTAFAIGAIAASFTFFFSLGYGARLIAPVMISAAAWRVLDILTGLIMFVLAIGLLTSTH